MSVNKVVVVGAGASGLVASGHAAELGAEVTLLEKMERPAKKLLISGNSRCNISNIRRLEDFIPMYGVNGKFLYHAFHHFFREELLGLLDIYGIETAIEADGRVFPASGKAGDIAFALMRYANENGASIVTGSRTTAVETSGGRVSGVQTIDSIYPAGAVVLATGGASYPLTGSTGEGYNIAEKLGHTIVRLRPALAPLVLEEKGEVKALQGISLQDISLTAFACPAGHVNIRIIPRHPSGRGLTGRKPPAPVIESRQGDIIFTHYGISGPAALLMSLPIADSLSSGNTVSVSIDLLPDKTVEQANKQLQELFAGHGSRLLHNVLESFITARITALVLERAGISSDKRAGQVSAAERATLATLVKGLKFNVKGIRPLAEAMVTAGGVSLDEINPHTMESKLVKGLFFCGEVMDIDADTGGYNLQAAFSTGYLAGESAARPD